ATFWRTRASKLGSNTAAAFVAGSPTTYPKFAMEPIRRCSKNIGRADRFAVHEPLRHRRRLCAAYALAQYSCQARALSSQAFRIWSRTFMRCGNDRDTRKAKPRMRTPRAVLSVAPTDKSPRAAAHADAPGLPLTSVAP